MRQRLDPADLDLLPDVPVEIEVVAVEGSQRADRLIERAGVELALALKVEEELEHARLVEAGEMTAGEVVGELADPTEIGLAGSSAQTFELDEADVFLIPLRRSEVLLFWLFGHQGAMTGSLHPFQRLCKESPRSGSVQQEALRNDSF